MHPCPCCGYKTLPERGEYDLCPVCRWEDEGLEPWEYSGPNAETLVEAQQAFLVKPLPTRRRGSPRAPRPDEARDPDWQPVELTEDLARRVAQANAAWELSCDEEEQRLARELEENPEGEFKEYNAAVQDLSAQVEGMPHREVRRRLRTLIEIHSVPFSTAHLELFSRLMKDDDYYRHHPVRAAWWMVRYARPGTVARRWEELRTGSIHIVS